MHTIFDVRLRSDMNATDNTDIAIPSVRLSVRHTPVLCPSG